MNEPADLSAAELIVVGPAPPLRGGIAAHTARLVEKARAGGREAAAVSYRRLYPALLFPGRSQRDGAERPAWSHDVLDTLDPRTWFRTARALERSGATIVLQWWHPVVAPALLAATRGIGRDRLVAICHNVLPHEPMPGAAALAGMVLGRCGRVLCHSRTEADAVGRVIGRSVRPEILEVPLPCLLSASSLDRAGGAPPGAPPGARVLLAAGHVRAYKGIDVLLKAWSLARRPADARLIVAGESYLRGARRREVLDVAQRDPSIILIDRYLGDDELVQWLGFAEALVAAHVEASQSGLVPIARALGLPCIVSDAGALAEQAAGAADPADTRVVEAGSVSSLTVAIEALLAAGPRPRSPRDRTFPDGDIGAGWQRVIEAIKAEHRPSPARWRR